MQRLKHILFSWVLAGCFLVYYKLQFWGMNNSAQHGAASQAERSRSLNFSYLN